MRIAIAGANSFIGKRLIPIALQNKDTEIIAVIRNSKRREKSVIHDRLKFLVCDMKDYDEIGRFVGKCDAFIDLSWAGSRGADRQDHDMQKFNYACNMAAMKSMADAGCRTLVSAGSQAEYGICEGIITEETECNPNTEYGKYKLEIYNYTKSICDNYKIRFIEPRYFSLYGPGDYEKTLIVSCMKKMLNGEDVKLNSCTQFWDYMYVDDAVQILLKLIYQDSVTGVFNFVTGEYKKLYEYIFEMRNALDSSSMLDFSGEWGGTDD